MLSQGKAGRISGDSDRPDVAASVPAELRKKPTSPLVELVLAFSAQRCNPGCGSRGPRDWFAGALRGGLRDQADAATCRSIVFATSR